MKKTSLWAINLVFWAEVVTAFLARLQHRAIWRATLIVLVAVVALVVYAVARDTYTARLAGSPVAPVCPEWASPRQRAVWRLLHAMDGLISDGPPLRVSRRRRRR